MTLTLREMVADPALSSDRTARILRDVGYDRVEVLGGGLTAWAQAGLPVESNIERAKA